MKRLIMALTIAALGLAFSGRAQAFTQIATGSMNVSATVPISCSVTTAPLDFGTLSPSFIIDSNTTVTVNCSTGVAYRIDLDKGQNAFSTSVYPRYVKIGTAVADNTNTTFYKLYNSANRSLSTEWGDNGATYCPTCPTVPAGKLGTGIGADEVHTIYGSVWSTVNPPGTYTDTVTVTVNY